MANLAQASSLRNGAVGQMLGHLDGYVGDFSAAYDAGSSVRLPSLGDLRHILITGMGGSGIGGNLVAHLVRPESPVPVVVRKGYGVPAYVGPNSLVVAVSYSGETEETLDVALAAKDRGATLVAISSGGRLQKVARGPRAMHVAVPGGRQPREALPTLFGTLLGIHAAAGVTRQKLAAADAKKLEQFRSTLAPEAPEKKNAARRWAGEMVDKFPYWYAGPGLAGVGLRARCQLNENAKMLGRNDDLPEANHNETVAWNGLDKAAAGRFFVGFLRTPEEPSEIRHRFSFVAEVLSSRGVAWADFVAEGSTPLAQTLRALMFVDYVSLYAAAARGVDPLEVNVITKLKDLLAQRGKAPELHRRIG